MIEKYKEVCYKIANDPKLPARIADWADALYMTLDGYNARGQREAGLVIRIDDLNLIESYIDDNDYAINLIDRSLCGR